MGWVVFILLALVVGAIALGIRHGNAKPPDSEHSKQHCMTCGYDATPQTKVKGSGLIELVLWLALIVPGLVYSIWRRTALRPSCSQCGSASLVPKDSPAAVAHRRDLGQSTQN